MKHSEQIDKLSEALAKAQGKIIPAEFDKSNPHFKSRYASLASIMNACRLALSSNGLAVVQSCGVDEAGRMTVTTMLSHESGQWVSGTLTMKSVQESPQGHGSTLTYLRRYSLAAMVGVVADDDDDGQAGSTKPTQTYPERAAAAAPKPPAKPAVKLTSADQLREITTLAEQIGHSDRAKILTSVCSIIGRDIASARDLTFDEAAKVIESYKSVIPEVKK